MRIEVNLEKKYFFVIMLIGLVLIGIAGVVAYYSDVGDPSIMGHSVGEMDWGSAIDSNVTAAGFCIGNDTYKSCIQSWGGIGGAGVSKIIAGSGIIISGAMVCAEGVGCSATGDVMINSTATGGGVLEVMKKQSPSQGMNEEVCCDAGWVRTGCGEGSDQSAYSYPAGDNCCHGGGFTADGSVYVICARGGGGGGGSAEKGTIFINSTTCHWVGSARCDSCRKNWECPAGEIATGVGGTSTGERAVDYLYVKCCKISII